MPVVVQACMLSNDVSTSIANHASVCFHFEEVNSYADFSIREAMCSKSLECVCLRCISGYKSCFLTWDREHALSVAMSVQLDESAAAIPVSSA